jgi:hypothetical protein
VVIGTDLHDDQCGSSHQRHRSPRASVTRIVTIGERIGCRMERSFDASVLMITMIDEGELLDR